MDTNIKKLLEKLIFYGTVCALTPKDGTVRVCREDKGNKVTNDMFVLQRGSSESKDFWMPAVGDQVLCIQMPNFSGAGVGDGFVLGTFFSSTDAPPGGADANTRVIDTPGNLKINIGGALQINASSGDVVVNGISLVSHVHSGVTPGGSKTSTPE